MRSIASLHARNEKCPTCQSQLQPHHFNSQMHCPQCQSCPQIYEKQVKFVPEGYHPKSQQMIPRNQVNIHRYLNQFANLCGISLKPQQTNTFIIQVISIRRQRGIHSKGYITHCAAVIYQAFREVHKMSIRQFCKKAQIKLNQFNKSYLVLYSNHKHHQKIYQNNNQHHIQPIQNVQQQISDIVDKLYSEILEGPFLESKKEYISGQIIRKTIEVQTRLRRDFNEIDNGLFYAIFIVLKLINAKCCFKRFKSVVDGIMGIKLKDKDCKYTKQLYQKLLNDQGTTTIGNESLVPEEIH